MKQTVFLVLTMLLVVLVGCSSPTNIIPPDSDSVTLPDQSSNDSGEKFLPSDEGEEEDLVLPVISRVRITDISVDSAIVRWTTDIPSDSKVKYGLGDEWSLITAYSEYKSSYTTEHYVKLRDLVAGSSYCVYYISSTGSGTAEYTERLVFNTVWPSTLWFRFNRLGSSSSSDGTVKATWNGGDGSWDDSSNIWTVSSYPAESKYCWFRISNETDSTVTVWLDTVLISCPAGGLTESNFTINSVVVPSGTSRNLEVVVNFTQSAPVGVYTGTFSINY